MMLFWLVNFTISLCHNIPNSFPTTFRCQAYLAIASWQRRSGANPTVAVTLPWRLAQTVQVDYMIAELRRPQWCIMLGVTRKKNRSGLITCPLEGQTRLFLRPLDDLAQGAAIGLYAGNRRHPSCQCQAWWVTSCQTLKDVLRGELDIWWDLRPAPAIHKPTLSENFTSLGCQSPRPRTFVEDASRSLGFFREGT